MARLQPPLLLSLSCSRFCVYMKIQSSIQMWTQLRSILDFRHIILPFILLGFMSIPDMWASLSLNLQHEADRQRRVALASEDAAAQAAIRAEMTATRLAVQEQLDQVGAKHEQCTNAGVHQAIIMAIH